MERETELRYETPPRDDPPTYEATPSWRTTYLGADTEGNRGNASWGAIFAGVVVALAVLITFSMVASTLGLGIADPTSDDPLENVGLAVGLWSILTLAVSLGAGGFTAGVLAVKAGFLHGLAVWATATIALLIAVVMVVSGVLGAAASLAGPVASAIGSGAGTLTDLAGDAVGASVDGISDQLGDVDTAALGDDVEQILIDTGVPELQPDYLQSQVDEVRTEVTDAAMEFVTDPAGYEEQLEELAASLEERVGTIAESVDREAIAAAVAENTELTGAEAEEAVDSAYEWSQAATDEVRQGIGQAQEALVDAGEAAGDIIEDARETLDDASDAAARASLWTFIGLVIAACVASFAGLWGSRLVVARTESGRVRLPGEPTDVA